MLRMFSKSWLGGFMRIGKAVMRWIRKSTSTAILTWQGWDGWNGTDIQAIFAWWILMTLDEVDGVNINWSIPDRMNTHDCCKVSNHWWYWMLMNRSGWKIDELWRKYQPVHRRGSQHTCLLPCLQAIFGCWILIVWDEVDAVDEVD